MHCLKGRTRQDDSDLILKLIEMFVKMWGDLIAKAKQGGLDVIQTYVFWNLHEPQPGKVPVYF